jgi:hypothetical protein
LKRELSSIYNATNPPMFSVHPLQSLMKAIIGIGIGCYPHRFEPGFITVSKISRKSIKKE